MHWSCLKIFSLQLSIININMTNAEDNAPPSELDKISTKRARTDTLWLDTIRRDLLDFDFEKLCSVSLTNVNVYACLVCGKYFQGNVPRRILSEFFIGFLKDSVTLNRNVSITGRGKTSFAYLHSVHEDHHVFINLTSQKV